jgi:hypothetical protein
MTRRLTGTLAGGLEMRRIRARLVILLLSMAAIGASLHPDARAEGTLRIGMTAEQARGLLAPLATFVLILLTLFGALPVYASVVGQAPNGEGSIGKAIKDPTLADSRP